MSLRLEVVEKGDQLEKLAEVSRRALELRRRIKGLMELLKERYSSNPRLSELVENIAKAFSPPQPPSEKELYTTSRTLEEYSKVLEEYSERLVRCAAALEKLEQALGRLEELSEKLKKWCELVGEANPYLKSEGLKLASRATKILESVPLEDPARSLADCNALVREMARQVKLCKRVYERRVDELLCLVESALKIAKRAEIAALDIERGSEVRAIMDRLRRILAELEDARRDPKPVKFGEVKREVLELKGRLAAVIEGSVSEEERKIMEELARLARASASKGLSLCYVAESAARAAGVSVVEALEEIYKLNKRGLIKVQVKVG